MPGIPLVHRVQYLVGLMDGDDRSLRQYLQPGIGYHGCDFDDLICLRVQAGHFQVDPDQVVFSYRHFVLRASRDCNMR